MYYHQTRQDALHSGAVFAQYFSLRAELVPDNGWVLVLNPRGLDFLQFPVAPILEVAEIDMTGFTRLRKRPPEFKKPPEAPKPAPAVKKEVWVGKFPWE